jgi:hypothetical protein
LKASKRPCNSLVATAIATVSATTIVEREKQSDAHRASTFLHQFAGHIVDRRDVVGVERVPQAKTVSEGRRAQEDRIVVEGDNRPQPGGGVRDE